MATSDVKDGYILLSDAPGDARRVQMILAEWGMDNATIDRMLREQRETARRTQRATGDAINPYAGRNLKPLAH
jgi:hypothetical protein